MCRRSSIHALFCVARPLTEGCWKNDRFQGGVATSRVRTAVTVTIRPVTTITAPVSIEGVRRMGVSWPGSCWGRTARAGGRSVYRWDSAGVPGGFPGDIDRLREQGGNGWRSDQRWVPYRKRRDGCCSSSVRWCFVERWPSLCGCWCVVDGEGNRAGMSDAAGVEACG